MVIILKKIENQFDKLSNITDKISHVNNEYESDIDTAINEMKIAVNELKNWELSDMSIEQKQFYLSHMSFHREIIADIIAEARSLLIDKYRKHVKTLVKYHRELCEWLNQIEK